LKARVNIKLSRFFIKVAAVLAVLYLLLLIPESDTLQQAVVAQPGAGAPFAWRQDAFWRALEDQFRKTKEAGCPSARRIQDSLFVVAEKQYFVISNQILQSDAEIFRGMEQTLFQLAPLIAACPERLLDFSNLVSRLRTAVKHQSELWDMNDPAARNTMYRLLYGGRAAVEEVMLQTPGQAEPLALVHGVDEPSQTPWAGILGVRINSGDILVSRGGAATSALIARGNDFPGNFSHVALVYVHPKTQLVSIIEAHIERGVTVSSMEAYLQDVKLRVMILRLRADLPQLRMDPQLPHKAAEYALQKAQAGHIPYDFTMDFQFEDKLFCSEVASAAYRSQNINLWMKLSQLSSPGLRRWLAGFGVRHFITQEPSDLEYDPQLSVVAEWRDLETLRKDHYDNAVTEVLLDAANEGAPLRYSWYLLPVARVLRVYSMLLNMVGKIGPIPEGMTATSALRNQWYTQTHSRIKEQLTQQAEEFQQQNGYWPPYWQLVDIARHIWNKMEKKI
jgi:hypothetical protein